MAVSRTSRPLTTLDLDLDATAPGLARAHVREHLTALDPTTLDDVLLTVSELVTNAVRHGAAPVNLTIETVDDHLRLAVNDGGAADTLPEPSHPEATAGNGRGLLLVAAVAASWGVVPRPGRPGKTVWASFRVTARETPVVVRLAGELDMAAVERTARQLGEVHLAADGEVRLDLSGATFVDSAVLHLFADLQDRAVAARCRVLVVGASGNIRRVIAMTGLGALLEPAAY